MALALREFDELFCLVDPIVEWPQVLLYVAVLTAIAFGLERNERANDRLIPVVDDTDAAPSAERDAVGVS